MLPEDMPEPEAEKEKDANTESAPGSAKEPKQKAGPVEDGDKPQEINMDQKRQIRDKLGLKEQIADDELSGDNWDAQLLGAPQAAFKDLAKACQVNTNGSKLSIMNRIIAWYSEQE